MSCPMMPTESRKYLHHDKGHRAITAILSAALWRLFEVGEKGVDVLGV